MVLIAIIFLIIITTLVYQVTAVVLLDQNASDQWRDRIEQKWGYTSCLVLDDSTRIIRILTLRCRMGDLRYVHVADGGTLLGDSPVDAFEFEAAKAWAKTRYGDKMEVRLSYYEGQTVLRVHSPEVEILIDPLTRTELWKVDLTYE